MFSVDAIKNWTEVGKNLFALLRDLVLFGVVFLLVGCPQLIGTRLRDAGITQLEGPGFKWEAKVEEAKKEALAAGQAVAQSKQQTDATLQKIDELVKKDPSLAKDFEPLQKQVVQAQATLSRADTRIASSIANQQDLLAKAGVATAALQGWVYLGSIDEDRKRWNRQNVAGDWPVNAGESRKVIDAVYVRTAGTPLSRSTARPLGAVQVGKSLHIEEIDTSVHLRAGGWTVWAKVTAEP